VRFGRRRRSLLSPDPDLVRTLAELLAQNGLSEIEYAVGDRLIRVSRSIPATTTTFSGSISTEVPAAPHPEVAASAAIEHPGAVTSPIVGTVYLAPQPGAANFVRLGETVEPGQPLLIIEAMKVMNEIRAPCAGRISQIMVEDTQPVEYGTALMLIE
jgi:acetyl-CoA carboxylase biotin carboxyl carrier protein